MRRPRLPGPVIGRVAAMALALAAGTGAGVAERAELLAGGSLEGWDERRFEGRTAYRTVGDGGSGFVRAESHGAASGMFRAVAVDLQRTPVLHWRWRARALPAAADERVRAGDDFAARVYVVAKDPWLFWRSHALSYVWAAREPAGSHWPNPFTGQVMMVVVRSGAPQDDGFVAERRDVRADFRALYGIEVGRIDAVAIMTDADNTGETAAADYADLYFARQ